MKRYLLNTLGSVVIILLGYFFFSPSGIDAVAWKPPRDPGLTGPYAPNNELQEAEILARGLLVGAEDVDSDGEGNLYAGLANGDVVMIPKGGTPVKLVNTGGRPLGLEFDHEGRLLIADARQGLLQLTLPHQLEVLSTQAGNTPINFADDVTVGRDGTIYFTDASQRWGIHHYRNDALEARPRGRLLAFRPGDPQSEVLLDGLYFANGVALAEDESFILVNETFRYRTRRLWLSGPRAGQNDVFLDNLPGFPDGISRDQKNRFWIAFPTPRNPMLDFMHRFSLLKELSVKLPPLLQPQPVSYGFIAAYDPAGNLLGQYQDPSGARLSDLTSVEDSPEGLLLGTLSGDRIGRFVPDL